ncbi:capping complex subunit for YIEGIA [Sporosarcina sp. NPDC096371]|uniref:capping complex subunit for YIEGIA n=1 Tax=Sporosarcina sp. NPDC096371 TaxID=3364530 RepID=UPI00381717C0
MGNQHAEIVAVVTMKPETIQGGGVPVFIAENKKHLQKTSLLLEKIMDAAAHEIEEETIIIVAR